MPPALPLLALICCARAGEPAADALAVALGEEELDGDWRGVSGLAVADGWIAVEERGHRLLIQEPARALRGVPVQGVPAGLDLEAVAIGADGVWLGTEGRGERDEERLLRVVLDGPDAGVARVVEERALPYAPFGLRGEHNRGVEGLCVAGGAMLAGAEVSRAVDGQRQAPAWLLQADGSVRPLWLGLRTRQGKLAALDCRQDGPDLVAWGIERHFGVRRILRWRIPPGPDLAVVLPEASWDLEPALAGAPNPEGLALVGLDPDGAVEVLVITDNESGPQVGPTRLARFRLAPVAVPR